MTRWVVRAFCALALLPGSAANAADTGATQFVNLLASRYADGSGGRLEARQNVGFSSDRSRAYFQSLERLDLAPPGASSGDSDLYAFDRANFSVRRFPLDLPPNGYVRRVICHAPRSDLAVVEGYRVYDPADPGGFRVDAFLANIATGQLTPLPTVTDNGVSFRYGGYCFANARDGSHFTFIGQVPFADGSTGATFIAEIDTTRQPSVVRACGDSQSYRDANNQVTPRSVAVQYLRDTRQVVLRGTILAPSDRSIRLSVLDCASSNLNRAPVVPVPGQEIPGLVGADLRYEQIANDGATASISGNRGGSFISYVVDRVTRQVLVAPEDIVAPSLPNGLSEDGRFLVASRYYADGRFDVAVVDVGTRRSATFLLNQNLQPFSSFYGDSFQFSEDGSLISYRGGGTGFATPAAGTQLQVYVSSNPFYADALPQGIVGGSAAALASAVSDDGRFVTFESEAAGLDPAVADGNGASDVFVLDRDSGQLKLVSTVVGSPGQARGGQKPALAGDGTRVAFTSVTPGSGKLDILVRNLGNQAVTLLSNLLGGNAASADLSAPSLSGDGYQLAFVASGASLLAADGDAVADVYRVDLRTRELVLASAGATAACRGPKLARSGVAIAFECGGTPAAAQSAQKAAPLPGALVLLYDIAARKLETVSRPPGAGAANGGSQILGVSGNGAQVLFGSDASNLVGGDTNGATDLFLGEVGSTVTVRRVASQSNGAQLDAPIDSGAISPDGNSIAFTTRSGGIDPLAGGTGTSALYLASLRGGLARKVRRGIDAGLTGDAGNPALTFDGSEVVFGAQSTGTGGPQSKAGVGVLNVANNPVVGTDARSLTSATSGFWFNPAQDLQGFLVESTISNGVPAAIVSWYVYQGGRPAWLFGSAPIGAGSTRVPMFITSGANFPPNYDPAARRTDPWGTVALKFSSPSRVSVTWSPTVAGFTSGSTTLQKLAGAAVPGNDRAGEIPACISGTWFNPAQDGQGLQIQKIDGNPASLVAIWYSYNQARQFWLLGQGAINGQGATLAMRAYTGAQFPPEFRTADVAGSAWGNVQFSRTGNDSARIQWTPTAAGFSAGSMDLVRLSGLTGRPCE
jgi:Tol biopolymer transport system component